MTDQRAAQPTIASSFPNAPCRLLLLCNEAMRKRCQCLSAALQTAGQGRARLVTVRLKRVTYIDEGSGAFSLSIKTDRLMAESDLVLCLLRVGRFQPEAWKQLSAMVASRHARFRNDDDQQGLANSRLMLVQCCGSAFVVDDASEAVDSDPCSVDRQLQAWLVKHVGCQPDDFANVSVENTSAGKALRHRLFGRRYTIQVEFAEHDFAFVGQRRHSLYRLTDGREAADGGCSPEAVMKRCQSYENRLDCCGLDSSCCDRKDLEAPPEQAKQLLFHLDFQKSAATPVTLVVSSSRSCCFEAELCLNNLSSLGHRVTSIDAFAASMNGKGQQLPDATSRRFLRAGRRLRNPTAQLTQVLTQLTQQTADCTIFLVFCRRYQSRLLSEFLRIAALPAPNLTAPPLACFAAIVGPVTEAECQKLRELSSGDSQLRCQLDVICCPEGLAGSRVLTYLVPGLTEMMRHLEMTAAMVGRDSKQ